MSLINSAECVSLKVNHSCHMLDKPHTEAIEICDDLDHRDAGSRSHIKIMFRISQVKDRAHFLIFRDCAKSENCRVRSSELLCTSDSLL